jgi:hypothetical protein
MASMRWADDSDSDDELFEFPEPEIELHTDEDDHTYMYPLTLHDITVETYQQFLRRSVEMAAMFDVLWPPPPDEPNEMWDQLDNDLREINDPETMDSASFMFMCMTLTADVTKLQGFVMPELAPVASLDMAALAESEAALKGALNDLTLDVFDKPSSSIKHVLPDDAYVIVPPLRPKPVSNYPPLAPLLDKGANAIAIRFLPRSQQDGSRMHLNLEWADYIASFLPDFPASQLDLGVDDDTKKSSHSNRRPWAYGAVHIVFDNATTVNVGSHGYHLSGPVDVPISFNDSRTALSEFFSAPGGEGMTCPTPSHLLHQMCSAVLSHAVVGHPCHVERDNMDITVDNVPAPMMSPCYIDITSSNSIWNKQLGPTIHQPKALPKAAISKYDLAAIIANECDDDTSIAFIKASANCLSCEYPYFYRLSEEDIPQDLLLQSAIYSQIASLTDATIAKLGHMCYEAAISECLDEISGIDIDDQGKTWFSKRDVLVNKIDELIPRHQIAIPPLPLVGITALPSDSFSINILGHIFHSPSAMIQGRSAGHQYSMDSVQNFMRHYPASGLVSHQESLEIAAMIRQSPLIVKGMTHKGPCAEYDGPDDVFLSMANHYYQHSSNAQFAEIRCDIVRAVYSNPMPKAKIWQHIYVYKSKVAVWYRCRDNPSSPNGYRIDWFAVSSFKTIGSIKLQTTRGEDIYLWPRQRIRSQEMSLIHMGPRRLKVMLYSMLEKASTSGAEYHDVWLAWEHFAMTLNSTTYASGKLFLTARYLSSTLSSPSSPFHEMAKKLENPINFGDIYYLVNLRYTLEKWVERDQYRHTCPLIRLPRAYAQSESYWMMWVPNEYADTDSNMSKCVLGLYEESRHIHETMSVRCNDLSDQYALLTKPVISMRDLRESLRASCTIETGGKLGWSWIGSLASGFALNLRSSARSFDAKYGRGIESRTMIDHLTVRHSARIDAAGNIKRGTVAEMMLDSGSDLFLSQIDQTYRFIYMQRPVFFNHPKSGEHKEREISITDPDSRIQLSDAELICGKYGKTTSVDFLKDATKNSKFYSVASNVLEAGGAIQSSDATRYGPNMSNMAIAIMLLYLGSQSTHLKWCASVYARLAYRRMLLGTEIRAHMSKMSAHPDVGRSYREALGWLDSLPKFARLDDVDHVTYTTSHHMGQGMSHHSSSLLHAGGLAIAVDAANRAVLTYNSQEINMVTKIMVTSDDSTLLVQPHMSNPLFNISRGNCQIASRTNLQMVRAARKISLRMVSVVPNLVKEMVSSVKGEFNSQDTGIGYTCPILGFRELISLIVPPSAPSLVGDYLNAHASSRDMAFAGQGIGTGNIAHRLMIDAIEERWKIRKEEHQMLSSLEILPKSLILGCSGADIVSSPASWLHPTVRASLYRLSVDKNVSLEDLDPNVRDTVFGPLMHIRINMSRQHRKAISRIKETISTLSEAGMVHQAELLGQTLRSTLSSARSRNLGRVATRIRFRYVSPKPYMDHTFERNTMMESTLTWLSNLNRRVYSMRPGSDDIRMGNSLAGFVGLSAASRFGYPKPPRQKIAYANIPRKPKFRTGTYGTTPFGCHALARSGCSVIPEYTNAEREAIQCHLAHRRHRRVSDHIQYGGSYVGSWFRKQSFQLVGLDIADGSEFVDVSAIQYGAFGHDAIDHMKSLSSQFPKHPVLALHRYDGVRGLWHCIHKGESITVSMYIDLDNHPGGHILHSQETGREVILALQGFDPDNPWADTAPHRIEIDQYCHGDYFQEMPAVVRSLESENMKSSTIKCANSSTVVEIDGVKTLVYTFPQVNTTPEQLPRLLPNVPYLRARVIAKAAMNGYWHTTLRGVAFRSYLRGHCYKETLWTGGVIGWRMSLTDVPSYGDYDHKSSVLSGLVILNGVNGLEDISSVKVDVGASGNMVLNGPNKQYFDSIIQVNKDFFPLILASNGNCRFHNGSPECSLLNMNHQPIPDVGPGLSPSEARDEILLRLSGEEANLIW